MSRYMYVPSIFVLNLYSIYDSQLKEVSIKKTASKYLLNMVSDLAKQKITEYLVLNEKKNNVKMKLNVNVRLSVKPY